MPRNRTSPDVYLLSKVSTLYYVQNQTQQEIAKRLGVSRPTISRLLQDAQDHGIVQITVAPQRGVYLELEGKLEEQFCLDTAQIVSVERDGSDLLQQLGGAAAAYLARTVKPDLSIGLAWARRFRQWFRRCLRFRQWAFASFRRLVASDHQTRRRMRPLSYVAWRARSARRRFCCLRRESWRRPLYAMRSRKTRTSMRRFNSSTHST